MAENDKFPSFPKKEREFSLTDAEYKRNVQDPFIKILGSVPESGEAAAVRVAQAACEILKNLPPAIQREAETRRREFLGIAKSESKRTRDSLIAEIGKIGGTEWRDRPGYNFGLCLALRDTPEDHS